MADQKISELTAVTTPSDADEFAINQGSASFKESRAQIVRNGVNDVTVTGSLTPSAKQLITLDSATAIALTLSGAPVVGDEIEIIRDGSGVVTHTVVLSGSVTWDGTNQTASFDTDEDKIRAIAVSTTRWRILENVGVTFSA